MENKKGFTLIELVIVISIIGILSTVAVINLSTFRNRAHVATFKAEVTAMQSQMISDCEALPDATFSANPPGDTTVTDWDAAFTATDCGPTGAATFSIDGGSQSYGACTATITQQDITYVAGCTI